MDETWLMNPSWWYMKISEAGSMTLKIEADCDVDYVAWGPFGSVEEAIMSCGSLTNIADCSYNVDSVEYVDLFDVEEGWVYMLMILNYDEVETDIHLTKLNGDADIACDLKYVPALNAGPGDAPHVPAMNEGPGDAPHIV